VNYAFNLVSGRKPEIRVSKPREYVVQRLADSAAQLSRAGVMAARVELVNEALCRLTELAYQRDSDGVLANVDSVTYRLLIAAPWGRGGWKRWGLRNHESRILGKILRTRQAAFKPSQGRPPLFVYDDDTRYWLVNMGDYETLASAHWYLQKGAISLAEWRRAGTEYGPQGRAKRRP
jgi:hypothetical protein